MAAPQQQTDSGSCLSCTTCGQLYHPRFDVRASELVPLIIVVTAFSDDVTAQILPGLGPAFRLVYRRTPEIYDCDSCIRVARVRYQLMVGHHDAPRPQDDPWNVGAVPA